MVTSLRRASDSAVRSLTSKTVAVLISRKRKHWQQREGKAIRVFALPGGLLDGWVMAGLGPHPLRELRRCLNRARQGEARLRRLVNAHEVPPASARNLQQSVVQGALLTAAELTWNSREGTWRVSTGRPSPHGTNLPRSLLVSPLGHRGGRKQHYPSESATRPPTGQVYAATRGQA